MARKPKETKPYDTDLGTDYDHVIAARHGVPKHVIYTRRKKLGIAAYKELDTYKHLLGTMPDEELAAQTGKTVRQIKDARAHFHIKVFKYSDDDIKFMESLLGVLPDHELAALTGRSKSAICRERQKRGIEAYNGKHVYVDWDKHEDLLGTMTDMDLAKQLGCSVNSVQAARTKRRIPTYTTHTNWNEYEHLLGTMSDADLAIVLNLDASTVSRQRRICGIPCYQEPGVDPDVAIPLMQQHGDVEVARQLGRSPKYIARLRKKLGVPVYDQYAKRNIDHKAIEKDLRTMTNIAVAAKHGLSEGHVSRIRRLKGIKRRKPKPKAKRVIKPENRGLRKEVQVSEDLDQLVKKFKSRRKRQKDA